LTSCPALNIGRHVDVPRDMTARPGFALTFGVCSLAAFSFALDRLVVSTALPSIQAELHSGPLAGGWVVTSYTLSFAVLLLGGAALGDRFGQVPMFSLGVAIYALGSATAALAPNLAWLVLARMVQGAGGAIFVPLSLAMVSAVAPAGRRAAVLGMWGAVGGLGAALGPLVGGGLTDLVGWRGIFWVNVPMGTVLMMAARRLPVSHGDRRRRLDVPGLFLSGAGLLSLVWTLARTADAHRLGVVQLPGLLAGALLLVAFLRREARVEDPMLTLTLFRHRSFVVAVGAAVAMYAALFGALFLIAQLLQVGLAASPSVAGARLLPMAVMPMLLTPVGGLLSDRIGPRAVLVAGLLAEVAGLWWLAAAGHAGVGYASLVPALVLAGAGSGLFFAPVMSSAVAAVPRELQMQAAGVISAVRELAVALGVTVLVLVFDRDGGTSSAGLFFDGFRPAMTVAGGLAAAGVLLVMCGHGGSGRTTATARRPRGSAARSHGRERLDGAGERRGGDWQDQPGAHVPVLVAEVDEGADRSL
jgi:EmrB/QacA subfamily drug resistance transporter